VYYTFVWGCGTLKRKATKLFHKLK
jgi:hypothetical protein